MTSSPQSIHCNHKLVTIINTIMIITVSIILIIKTFSQRTSSTIFFCKWYRVSQKKVLFRNFIKWPVIKKLWWLVSGGANHHLFNIHAWGLATNNEPSASSPPITERNFWKITFLETFEQSFRAASVANSNPWQIFIGPESDHCLLLSVTDSLAPV